MFIDMHTHTSGISLCCRADRYEVLKVAKENDYDTIVITNHYTDLYFDTKTHED